MSAFQIHPFKIPTIGSLKIPTIGSLSSGAEGLSSFILSSEQDYRPLLGVGSVRIVSASLTDHTFHDPVMFLFSALTVELIL